MNNDASSSSSSSRSSSISCSSDNSCILWCAAVVVRSVSYVCLSVCAVTFKTLDLETSFLLCEYVIRISRSGFPKRKLSFPGHQISWVSDWVRDFSPWASSAMEAANETNFGTSGWGWCPNVKYMHSADSAEKAHDTTLDEENALQHDVHFSDGALCNQTKTFASDIISS